MECKQCGTHFEQRHFNQKLCSPECKRQAIKETKRRYKQTEKGKETERRWIESDRRWLNEKRYRQSPSAKKRAVERQRKYSQTTNGNIRKKQTDTVYMSRTQGRLRKWWAENAPNGCTLCGKKKDLTVDHIIAVTNGGELLDTNNLQILCRPCNAHKGNKKKLDATSVATFLRRQQIT